MYSVSAVLVAAYVASAASLASVVASVAYVFVSTFLEQQQSTLGKSLVNSVVNSVLSKLIELLKAKIEERRSGIQPTLNRHLQTPYSKVPQPQLILRLTPPTKLKERNPLKPCC